MEEILNEMYYNLIDVYNKNQWTNILQYKDIDIDYHIKIPPYGL